MVSRIMLLLGLVLGGWQSASAAGVVRIADGDCTGLSAAIAAARNAGGSTTVLLARSGTYTGCAFNLSAGNVVIDGQGARVQGLTACMDAPLTLRNMTLEPTRDGNVPAGCSVGAPANGGSASCALVASSVSLNLESVTFQGFSYPTCTGPLSSVINSSGNLTLRNVTADGVGDSLIVNSGTMAIYNSTFFHNAPDNSRYPLPLIYFLSGSRSRTTVANSLFAENVGPVCGSGVDPIFELGITLAGNVTDRGACSFAPDNGGKVVTDAQLGSFANHGGLIPTIALNSGSPARGAGVAQYCEATDARGYTRSPHGCDAGAYEYGGGSGALTVNGLNGFYYDPDANGHYVSLQRIHDNGDIAIVWSTFDANGNQAWVYGVGQLSDRHIHASMAQNIGGMLQPGGAPTGSSVRPWGTVDIDLTSCALAQFSYASTLNGFGSGQFPLTRLAYVSDFGCAD